MKEQLMKELKQAMKDKDTMKKGLLQLLISRINNEKIALKRDLTEEEEIDQVKKEMKQTKFALAEAKKADREDIVKQQQEKVVILKAYLPNMLTAEQILAILEEKGAKKGMPIGALMGMVMKEHKSEVDGNLVKEVVEKHFK